MRRRGHQERVYDGRRLRRWLRVCVGKQLCRGEYAKPADAKTSSWYSACSHRGQDDYPYGSNYLAGACNGQDSNEGAPGPVEGHTACTTPDGVLNLTGNVAEWVDECIDAKGMQDACKVRGGSYRSEPKALRCDAAVSPERGSAQPYYGFRCCAY